MAGRLYSEAYNSANLEVFMAEYTIGCDSCGWEDDIEADTPQEAEERAEITACGTASCEGTVVVKHAW